ncbi:type VII secretion protein EccB [Mycolicibacterium fortuitum subsp. acetamidolyticum]|uniref:Type VII secretion protein EccB n=1 Tax=Mycolicibacterium fortuitum subsp. acetamidolyticum TaxID=144550 RepID=A0A100WQX3_MYCFO|nr:type VII secretion protein EccB [Mycolicibacterium fortuitum]MCV7137653.1 type VII secretion protein EccB [Mycolicibacterium fortuitum]GAT02520.1 type VII secretion protein EccB [Mycolicibacterium fortuitum subsp. acetamidolyticum]
MSAPTRKRPTSSEDNNASVVSSQNPPSWQLTTKVSVSGVRFLLRRLENAIVRRNTAQFDDPLRFYSRATTYGIIGTVIVAVICVGLAYFKPQGMPGADRILRDTASSELFLLDDANGSKILRPVLNLTSARLLASQHATPRAVKGSELGRYPRGQKTGIPGAPYDTPFANGPASYWSACDTVSRPTSAHPEVSVSVLADEPIFGPGTATPITGEQAILARYRDQTYLVDATGRHALDLTNTAVTSAIGLPPATVSTPLSEAMYNAIPAGDPLVLPEIAQAGAPNTVGLAPNITIGTVITDGTAAGRQLYVVLADGIARIDPATASALRNTDTFGHLDPPVVPADKIAAAPTRTYDSPLHRVQLVDRAANPVLCWSWSKTGTDAAAPQTVISAGKQLPLPQAKLDRKAHQDTTGVTVYQTGAGRDGNDSTGRFVRIINPTGNPESRFYIDPGGIRYGLPETSAEKALGLSDPQLAPWPVIRLLAVGPDLTQGNAALSHDSLPPDPSPKAIPTTASAPR